MLNPFPINRRKAEIYFFKQDTYNLSVVFIAILKD